MMYNPYHILTTKCHVHTQVLYLGLNSKTFDLFTAKAITTVPELNANKNFINVWLCWEQTNLTNRKLCLIKSNCIASSYINAK